MEPRERINQMEQSTVVPDGGGERFRGYGVMALPFQSGHILGLRRFPASSIGPNYTSVWHREPQGNWTFYTDVAPQLSCNRYFGSGVDGARECPIEIEWSGPVSFSISVAGGEIDWWVTLQSTPVTRLMSGICDRLPESLWSQPSVLTAMGTVGGHLLSAGKISLHGHTCNGQEFNANPRHIWTIPESKAIVRGVDLSEVGPIAEQTRLGDFWLPQRGLFMIGDVFMEEFNPVRHRDLIS